MNKLLCKQATYLKCACLDETIKLFITPISKVSSALRRPWRPSCGISQRCWLVACRVRMACAEVLCITTDEAMLDDVQRRNCVGGIPRSDEYFGVVDHAGVSWRCLLHLRSFFDVVGTGTLEIERFGVVVYDDVHAVSLVLFQNTLFSSNFLSWKSCETPSPSANDRRARWMEVVFLRTRDSFCEISEQVDGCRELSWLK